MLATVKAWDEEFSADRICLCDIGLGVWNTCLLYTSQAGYFLIVACQRPDAKYFSDGIRDNFNFRVGLGRISELGYGMLFGSDVKKQFFQKRIKGRGYCDVGTSVISEFYTPLVPKGHDFLQTIGSLAQNILTITLSGTRTMRCSPTMS